jgi:hypothetical protein
MTMLHLVFALLLTGHNNSWLGTYLFEEADGPVTGTYQLTVKGQTADLDIDGFQTKTRLRADVKAEGPAAVFTFRNYRPTNIGEGFKPGDHLFTLSYQNKTLLTRWVTLQPLLPASLRTGFAQIR